MTLKNTWTRGLSALAFALVVSFGVSTQAQSITGEWEVAGGAMYGKLIPSNVAYTMTLNITGDQFSAESGNLKSTGTVTADTQSTPPQITFKIDGGDDPGRELKGIFKFEGRNMMITFSETDQFPNVFESTADNGYLALSYQASTGRSLARDNNNNNANRGGIARDRRRPTTPGRPATPPQAANGDSGAEAF